MSRGHTPYGYRIENGIAVVCEEQAAQIRKIYEGYLGGLSLRNAAKEAGITATHSSVKRLLQNPHFLGDDFYPAIIDSDTFHRANCELKRRAANKKQTGKSRREIPVPESEFTVSPPQTHYSDPYEQAEYLYSLIESKVVKWQK